MMSLRVLLFFIMAWTSVISFPGDIFAEIVKEIGPDGILILQDGKKVVLAGVLLDEEGLTVLRVLAKNQDLRFHKVLIAGTDSKEYVYAYLMAKSFRFPFKANELSDQKEVMLNEFLLRTGAARVMEKQDFGEKEKFLKIQEEAMKKGEGLWSYARS